MFVLCCLQTQIANAMVASIYQHEISKAAGMTSANQLPPHPLPPAPQTAADLDPRYTQELVANIYRQELTKLAVKAEQCGNYAERDAYRRQLDKLAADAEAAADCRRGRLRPGRKTGSSSRICRPDTMIANADLPHAVNPIGVRRKRPCVEVPLSCTSPSRKTGLHTG